MNLFQKRAALLKVAQVKSAMRHVLRGRMAKQAETPAKVDTTSYSPNPKEDPNNPVTSKPSKKQYALPKKGKPLQYLAPQNYNFNPDFVSTPSVMQPGSESLPGVNLNGLLFGGSAYPIDEKLKSVFPPRSPFRSTSEAQINGVTNPSVPGNTLAEKLDNLNFSRDQYGRSNSPSHIPEYIPEWYQDTGRPLEEAPWQRDGSRGGVPDFGDMSEFNVKDRTMLGEQPPYARPYIEDAVRQSAMKATWQDIRKKAIQEAQNYYRINGIPREKINDKDYRARMGRIIERLAAEDMKVEPGAYPKLYDPYDPKWTD